MYDYEECCTLSFSGVWIMRSCPCFLFVVNLLHPVCITIKMPFYAEGAIEGGIW